MAKAGASIQDRRVDVWFSRQQYDELLELRSRREAGNGKTISVNQIVRDLVAQAYAAKAGK